MSKLIKHEPYSGSTKQFFHGFNTEDVRIASSRNQAIAVRTQAGKLNVTTTRKKIAGGRYAIRRIT